MHKTILGTRGEKIVVACEDFLEDGDRLYEFDKIKVTFEPHQEHPFLQDITGVQEHFWNMFVVDALIGNTDRNNSNWGIILRKDESKIAGSNCKSLLSGRENKHRRPEPYI